jgi:hypothetical protein
MAARNGPTCVSKLGQPKAGRSPNPEWVSQESKYPWAICPVRASRVALVACASAQSTRGFSVGRVTDSLIESMG